MVKQLLKGSVGSLSNHIDPEKEEQFKCVKIEVGSKIDQILTLAKNIDKGNKDAKLRKKSELITLVDDFHKQYESLYALYDNLRGEIRQKVYTIDDDDGDESPTSTYNSDTEIFFSTHDEDNVLNVEYDDVLMDKLTSTSVVMEPLPSSFSQVPESVEFVKDLGIETEHRVKDSCDSTIKLVDDSRENSESCKLPHMLRDIECATDHPSTHSDEMVEKLVKETSWLKEMISKKEEEMVSLSNKHQLHESTRLTQTEELEIQLANVKQELDQTKFKSSSVTKTMNEQISELQAQISELRSENQSRINSESCKPPQMLRDIECGTDHPSTRSDEMVEKLLREISWLKEMILKKEEEMVSLSNRHQLQETERLTQIKELESQLANVKQESDQTKFKSSSVTKKMNDEISSHENQKEQEELQMRSKIKDLTTKVNELQNELDCLHKEKKDLEDQLCSKAQEAKEKYALIEEQSRMKQEQLSEKIHKLHASLSKREDDLLTLHKEYQLLENEQKLSSQRLNEMEHRNLELTNKVSEQEKKLEGMTKLKDNQIQRKIDEIADEFLKKFEDHLCILSRRIKVAEQLQVEVKEWYTNTRKNDAQEKYNSNVELRNVSNVVGSLDGVALKFEECTTNFMNRISNVSCELKFAREWVRRKKKTMVDMKDDQDCLLAQLDEKEAEILMFRERLWKHEIRERELENLVNELQEYMLGLKEEKREAIRQLCVWIDYHRSRCDYYRNIFTDIKAGSKKTS